MAYTSSFGLAGGRVNSNTNNSYELPQCPNDSISQLSWHPTMTPAMLAASSWDGTVRVWEIQMNPGLTQMTPGATQSSNAFSANPKCGVSSTLPVLCCSLSRDNMVFYGGCDNAVRMHNMQTNQSTQIGSHDAPVCRLFYVSEGGSPVVVTGSWDGYIKVWDARQPQPAHTCQLSGKLYAMDVKYPAMVCATSDKYVSTYNLQQLSVSTQPMQRALSRLKLQSRTISLFPDKSGYAIGSIEGRASITYLGEKAQKDSFEFKCHRIVEKDQFRIYSVNSIDFHLNYGTFTTAGSDGNIIVWDKDNRMRVGTLNNVGCCVNDSKFDPTGKVIAFAVSYDWSKGFSQYVPQKSPNKIYLNIASDEMFKPKPKTTGGRT